MNKLTWKGLNYVKNVTRQPEESEGNGGAKAQTDRHLPPFYYYYFSYHTALDSEVIFLHQPAARALSLSLSRAPTQLGDFMHEFTISLPPPRQKMFSF